MPPATGTRLSTRMLRPAAVDAQGPAAARRWRTRAARTARWVAGSTSAMARVVTSSTLPSGRYAIVSTRTPGVLEVRTVTVSRRFRASKIVTRGW